MLRHDAHTFVFLAKERYIDWNDLLLLLSRAIFSPSEKIPRRSPSSVSSVTNGTIDEAEKILCEQEMDKRCGLNLFFFYLEFCSRGEMDFGNLCFSHLAKTHA